MKTQKNEGAKSTDKKQQDVKDLKKKDLKNVNGGTAMADGMRLQGMMEDLADTVLPDRNGMMENTGIGNTGMGGNTGTMGGGMTGGTMPTR